MAPRKSFHAKVINALFASLSAQAPTGLGVTTQMTVRVGDRQRLEPDVLVVDESALVDNDLTRFSPQQVH